MLVVQFTLGIAYNLYGTMPAAHQPIGMLSSGPVLILHEIAGLVILGGSVHVLMNAIRSRSRPAIAVSVAGLLAIAGAAAGGIAFLGHGSSGASMGMAMDTAAAMLCYLVNLAVSGSPRTEHAVPPQPGP